LRGDRFIPPPTDWNLAWACLPGWDVLTLESMITTRRGDGGETDLLFGRRVAKTDARIEAVGACDELMSALGLARAASAYAVRQEAIRAIQKDLIMIMGQIAGAPAGDEASKHRVPNLAPERLTWLDAGVATLEKSQPPVTDWVLPGANQESAALDFSRTAARRAERVVLALDPEIAGGPMAIYLNRVSDYLWLLAREVERETAG
jgi:cob(I)alamin adenosyltransferase